MKLKSRAELGRRQFIAVQVSYDPGWRAWINGEPRRILRDGLGLMVIDARLRRLLHGETDLRRRARDVAGQGSRQRLASSRLSVAMAGPPLEIRVPLARHFSPIPGNGGGWVRGTRFHGFWASSPLGGAAVRQK